MSAVVHLIVKPAPAQQSFCVMMAHIAACVRSERNAEAA
jgi:hypothetical protein